MGKASSNYYASWNLGTKHHPALSPCYMSQALQFFEGTVAGNSCNVKGGADYLDIRLLRHPDIRIDKPNIRCSPRCGEGRCREWMEGIASPASIQHVGHEGHRVHTSDNVHHIDHHSGEGGGQRFRDDGARGRPCKHFNLTRSVKYHIPIRVQRSN